MEKSRIDLTLGNRLATRYIPNQIFSSTLSWGCYIGVDEVWKLEKCFAERNILHGEDGPALTKEWLVYYIMEILENKIKTITNSVSLEDMIHSDVLLLTEEKMHVYKTEVEQWVSSFAIQLAAYDTLLELCEASNDELEMIEQHLATSGYSCPIDVSEEEKMRGGCTSRTQNTICRAFSNIPGRSLPIGTQRKGLGRPQEIVRWSDLLTNFVHDYEHFHCSDNGGLFFAQVRKTHTSGRPSPLCSSTGKDTSEKDWSRVASQTRGFEQDAESMNWMHLQSADSVLVSLITGCIITSSKDGIVKLWDGNTGVFKRNLYNAGSSWVIGMFLLQDEEYVLIATSNSQLTILDFPEGNVVQKFLGCSSIQSAFNDVVQLSATDVRRYGMKPGECGAYRLQLKVNETAEEYHRRRREAQSDVLPKNLLAKPMIGFTSPTSCWLDTYTGIYFFGTANGTVGAFDISADVRPSSLLAGANCRPVSPLFLIDVHIGSVVGIFYTSYASSIFTAGTDGCIYRTPLKSTWKPAGESRLVGHQSKSIRMMKWWPPSKYYVTIHVDRRVALWVIGRHGDALHHYPSESQEVVSAALHPRLQRLALLFHDKTIKVYDTHGSKSLATILQPAPDSNFSAADVTRQMMERSASDEDGVVAWHPHYSYLICCLRSTVIYAPSKNFFLGAGDELLSGLFAEESIVSTDCEPICGESDAKLLCSRKSSVSLPESRRVDSHRGGIVAMAVQKQLSLLHTFDEDSWRLWDLHSGLMKRHVDVPRVSRRENISAKRVTVASCSWTTNAQTRLVTGGQDCSLVTWDPATAAPLAVEMLVQDPLDQLDSDVFLFSHRNILVAWSACTCRVINFNIGAVLPSGIEEHKSIVLHVPSLTSLTACCVVRDAYLCFGTCDARIFFYSIRGGAPTHEHVLLDKLGEKAAIVHIIFLNEQNQNIILVFLDNGILCVYSYINQNVVYRVRLLRRFEARIRKVLYIPEDSLVVFGDTMGRVCALDVLGCTSVSVDFRNTFFLRFVFQGALDEITSLEYFRFAGQCYLIIGSLDHQVRLFQFYEKEVSLTLSVSATASRNSPLTILFVGLFGRDTWNLLDTTTFSDKPPVVQRRTSSDTGKEELLLESIINPDITLDSGRSAIASLTESDNFLELRGRLGFRDSPQPSLPSMVGATSQRPFFFAETSYEEVGGASSAVLQSCSNTKLLQQQQPQPQQQQQGERLLTPFSSFNNTTTSARLQGGMCSFVSQGRGRRSQLRFSPQETLTEQISFEQMSNSTHGTTGTCQGSASEQLKFHEKALSAMTRRLEAAMLNKCLNSKVRGSTNELLLNGEVPLSQVDRSFPHFTTDSHELRLALETRSRLAERMEKYKRDRVMRNSEKKSFLPLISAKHQLAPVVIPQPSIVTDVAKPGCLSMLGSLKMPTQRRKQMQSRKSM